jgi:hypothetical protein
VGPLGKAARIQLCLKAREGRVHFRNLGMIFHQLKTGLYFKIVEKLFITTRKGCTFVE